MGAKNRNLQKDMVRHSVLVSVIQVVALMAIMKLAAFFKQIILAYYFGTTIEIDLYLLSANTIGDFSLAVFSAFSVSVMTLYSRRLALQGEQKASEVISTAFKICIPAACILSALLFLLSPQLAAVLASNYNQEAKQRVTQYLRIVSPTIMFLSVAYIYVAIADARKIFWLGKSINIILSGSIIAVAVIFKTKYGSRALIITYMLAYFTFMAVTVLYGTRYFDFRKSWRAGMPQWRAIISMFLPTVLGNAAVEINALIDKLIALRLGEGFLSAQGFGDTLNNFVCSILILTPASVLVSYFAEYFAKKEENKIEQLLNNGILISAGILVPITLVTLFCSKDITSIVYERGAFDKLAVNKTAAVLCGYAIGFSVTAAKEILIKVHFANRDGSTVTAISIIIITINIISSIALSKKWGIIGISLGTSLASAVGLILCTRTVKQHLPAFGVWKLMPELAKIVFASLVAGAGMIASSSTMHWSNGLIRFTVSLFVVVIIDTAILFLCKSKLLSVVKKIAVWLLKREQNT